MSPTSVTTSATHTNDEITSATRNRLRSLAERQAEASMFGTPGRKADVVARAGADVGDVRHGADGAIPRGVIASGCGGDRTEAARFLPREILFHRRRKKLLVFGSWL